MLAENERADDLSRHMKRSINFGHLGCVALLLLAALATVAVAEEIRTGAVMQVKANSIWFDDAPSLAQWQKLKQSGDAPALAAYEKDKLGSRDAWQFINPLTVKVLGYQLQKHQVEVEATTKGRFEGLHFYVDADALQR